VWTGGKSRLHRDSIPDRPVRSSVAIPTDLTGSSYIWCITEFMPYVMPSLFRDVLQRKPKISRLLFVAPFQVYSLVKCDAMIWFVCSFGGACSLYHPRRQNLTTHIKYYFFAEIWTKEFPVLFKL